MLDADRNQQLTTVDTSTPMGSLLRRYWLPALRSTELDRDGRPRRIRLLGEDLLAFRDTRGRVGVVEPHCAHRGAALYFGRNEDCGLRCAFHGWKYDTTGRCVDMPNELSSSSFKEKVRLLNYPTREAGGVIWAYLGPLDASVPPLPHFEWMDVPEQNRFISYRYQYCNWVQALEGGVDTSHISFLHAPLDPHHPDESLFSVAKSSLQIRLLDGHPRFETVDTDYGVMIGARRVAEIDRWYYWRISLFLMPFYNMVAPGGSDPNLPSKAWVPVDREACINWSFAWHPTRSLREDEVEELRRGIGAHFCDYLPETPEPYGWVRPRASKENDYLIDWSRQRTGMFSGILGVGMQDQAMQETAGTICDRTREHLGAADLAVLSTRRRLLRSAEALTKEGAAPPGSQNGEVFMKRGAHMVLGPDENWVEAAGDLVDPESGLAFAEANRRVEAVNRALLSGTSP